MFAVTEAFDALAFVDGGWPWVAAGSGLRFEQRGRKVASTLVPGGLIGEEAAIRTHLKKLLPILRRAHAFHFRNLVVSDDMRRFGKDDPRGIELFRAGKLRMPFPVCWVDFLFPGTPFDAALLIEDDGEGLTVHSFNRIKVDDVFVVKVPTYRLRLEGEDMATAGTGGVRRQLIDPFGHFGRLREEALRNNPGAPDGGMSALVLPYMATKFLMAFCSREKRVETVEPGVVANRRRSDRGLMRMPECHMVTLIGELPSGYRYVGDQYEKAIHPGDGGHPFPGEGA